MADGKIKIKEIEGSQEEVIGFFQKSGLDIGDYLNSAKAIKVPFYSIVACSVAFLLFVCIASCLEDNIQTIFIILSLAAAFANIGLIYMAWKNKTLTGIISLGEALIFAIALHVYTPKEVVNKVEHNIENFEKKQ
ncbi:MAG: hypothetical protein IJQ13_04500 [Prevotella sp.]|nr:hypothetical protein [Prevotella sp.]